MEVRKNFAVLEKITRQLIFYDIISIVFTIALQIKSGYFFQVNYTVFMLLISINKESSSISTKFG